MKKKTTRIAAGKVILAIGSPPIKAFLKPQQEANQPPAFTYIADTYSPNLELNLKCILTVLSEIPKQSDRNILMLWFQCEFTRITLPACNRSCI